MALKNHKLILILGIFLIVFALSCQKKEVKINEISDQNELSKIIADKKTGYSNYVRAIQQLDANLTPSFWSSIANDEDYSYEKRQVAVVELFQRFVKPGITLNQLGDILNKPTWLKDDDINLIEYHTGPSLLKYLYPGSVFYMFLFRDIRPQYQVTIGIRIEGKITKEDFLKAIKGQEVGQNINDAKILETGMDTIVYKKGFQPSDLYDTSSYIQKKEGAK